MSLNAYVVEIYIALQNMLLFLARCVFFKPGSKTEPRTILVYRTARLGDFIVAVPALAVLRRRFPSARIVLLTTSSTISSMQKTTGTYTGGGSSLPWLSLIVPSLVDQAVVLSMQSWRSGISQARQCVLELHPDMTFILPFSGEDGVNRAKKILFLWLAGVCSPMYGWRVYSTTRFMRDVQYRAGVFEHQVWGPLRAVMECPLVPVVGEQDVTFPLMVGDAARLWSQQLWERQGWTDKPVVAVFPGGTFPHKRWPVDRFIALCEELHERHGAVFAVIGANTDREWCGCLSAALGNEACLDLAGQTTVMQLAALLERSTFFLGNDSGPAHVAWAVGSPCVTIFSSIEFPDFWEPLNPSSSTIRHQVPCAPCFSFTDCPLGTRECIGGIQVGTVMQICEVLLHQISTTPASGVR